MQGLRPLFQINADLASIIVVVEDCDGELDRLNEAKDAFVAFMDSTTMEAEAKAENCAFAVKHLRMLQAATKAELDQFKKRMQSLENAEAWIKENLKTFLTLTGQTKMSTPSGHEISLRNNGGLVWPVVDDEAFNKLDRGALEFLEDMGILVLQPMLNKDKLRKMIEEQPDRFGWAKAGTRGQHVQVK